MINMLLDWASHKNSLFVSIGKSFQVSLSDLLMPFYFMPIDSMFMSYFQLQSNNRIYILVLSPTLPMQQPSLESMISHKLSDLSNMILQQFSLSKVRLFTQQIFMNIGNVQSEQCGSQSSKELQSYSEGSYFDKNHLQWTHEASHKNYESDRNLFRFHKQLFLIVWGLGFSENNRLSCPDDLCKRFQVIRNFLEDYYEAFGPDSAVSLVIETNAVKILRLMASHNEFKDMFHNERLKSEFIRVTKKLVEILHLSNINRCDDINELSKKENRCVLLKAQLFIGLTQLLPLQIQTLYGSDVLQEIMNDKYDVQLSGKVQELFSIQSEFVDNSNLSIKIYELILAIVKELYERVLENKSEIKRLKNLGKLVVELISCFNVSINIINEEQGLNQAIEEFPILYGILPHQMQKQMRSYWFWGSIFLHIIHFSSNSEENLNLNMNSSIEESSVSKEIRYILKAIRKLSSEIFTKKIYRGLRGNPSLELNQSEAISYAELVIHQRKKWKDYLNSSLNFQDTFLKDTEGYKDKPLQRNSFELQTLSSSLSSSFCPKPVQPRVQTKLGITTSKLQLFLNSKGPAIYRNQQYAKPTTPSFSFFKEQLEQFYEESCRDDQEIEKTVEQFWGCQSNYSIAEWKIFRWLYRQSLKSAVDINKKSISWCKNTDFRRRSYKIIPLLQFQNRKVNGRKKFRQDNS